MIKFEQMTNSTSKKSGGLIRAEVGRKKDLWRTNVALLISLVLIIFILPAVIDENHLFSRLLLALVVISGLYAAEFGRNIFKFLFALGAIVIIVTIFELFLPNSKILNIGAFFMYTLFFIVVTIALITHVARAKSADRSTVLCAINSYLLMGLTMSIFVVILDLYEPQSFLQIDFISDKFSSYVYFGFVTLTTLGYGDISPNTSLARSLCTFTALIGQLYLVIVMALIIGKYLNSKPSNEKN